MKKRSSNHFRILLLSVCSVAITACTVNPNLINDTSPQSDNSGAVNTTTNNTTSYNNYEGVYNPQKGFAVQLIATISPEKADRISQTFTSEGYHVIQNSIVSNGQRLYRVQIGPFVMKHEAVNVLEQMRRRYHQNELVDVAFINENK